MNDLDRLNRTVVTVLAVVLIAIGGYGVLRGFDIGDLFGNRQQDSPFLGDDLRDVFGDNEWLWWLVALAALALAYLGWRWLRLQLLPSPSVSSLQLEGGQGGRTDLPASAVASAVTADLDDDPDIRSARVRVVGNARRPGLDVRVGVADSAEPVTVRRRIEESILPRARQALERDDLTTDLRIRLGDPTVRAVE